MVAGSLRYLRQIALPGWGISAQERVSKVRLSVQGGARAAGLCRDYLQRGGATVFSSGDASVDLDIQFGQAPIGGEQAFLISLQDGETGQMVLWKKGQGPCADCLWTHLGAPSSKGGLLDGAAVATAVMLYLMEPGRWNPGRVLSWGNLSQAQQTRDLAPTRECEACGPQGSPSRG